MLGLLDQQVLVREDFGKVLGDSRRVLFVFDREGDIFEAVEAIQDAGARFVIRASVNRRLERDSDSPLSYLFETVAAEPVRAQKEIVIPAGGGRKERTVLVSLRAGAYTILPPQSRDRSGDSRLVNGVSIREENPPLGEDPDESRDGDTSRSPRLPAGDRAAGWVSRAEAGRPGWITLWRGLSRLNDIEVGFNLACPAGDVGNG